MAEFVTSTLRGDMVQVGRYLLDAKRGREMLRA